jgi:hypothetical protein
MLDHLVYATPDVQGACDDLEQRLGVRPTLGGRFAQMGAYNHILALGNGAYVEVIGPDPDAAPPSQARPFGIDNLRAPRLVTWAAKATELAARVDAARAAGYDLGRAQPLSRTLSDGTTLAWELTVRTGPPGPEAGLAPFLIDWGDATHPSTTGAQGCRLVSLHGEHPDPALVQRALSATGVELDVRPGDAPALVAVIEGPAGRAELR